MIEYVRRKKTPTLERLRTHEDFRNALILLTFREQNDAHQNNWKETYEKEMKKRVVARRVNKKDNRCSLSIRNVDLVAWSKF